ncbi:Glutathione synthase/RimK-type ligase, ATP-grasp superfamily [Seinonella peptonophila]|uniref:Glutathione synthase/RimK-type ligase, ATP-grasp superfamily n=1 Tax=Seinonella peptonophila TaxID=112248 RepID=A0A1M4W4X5_9BACL|nr:YheC/YheD family protein [Seinonella peptonophila]SHE76205.1 Glutathione synthase/RimK-type ligase, ATP-grasp superfamily [Seinonella peptonophila]
MGQARIQIQVMPENQFPIGSEIVISSHLAKRLGIGSQTINIQHGSANVSAMLSLSANPSSLVRICSSLATALKLTDAIQLNVQYHPQQLTLSFGPLVGIMINLENNQQHKPVFGEMARFFDECFKAAQQAGIRLFIFTPEQLSMERKTIRGWSKFRGRWIETNHPLPHVIYNRITSRRIEEDSSLQKQLDQLRKKHQVQIFNEQFLNKWEVHQLFSQDSYISEILPETKPYDWRTLLDMAKSHPILYLKPVNGSLGQGIIRLIHTPIQIRYQSETAQGNQTFYAHSWKKVIQRLNRRIGKQSYLIQQGLLLIKHLGRPIDFRILCQKNHQGKWSVTSAVGRIGKTEHFVSNLARGGMILAASNVLDNFIHSSKPTIQQLHEIALNIANRFDQLTSGHFAELGIDLGLDRKGKVWLIEINSKPSKTDDSVVQITSGIRPSVRKLTSYICFLTGIKQTRSFAQKRRKKGD